MTLAEFATAVLACAECRNQVNGIFVCNPHAKLLEDAAAGRQQGARES